MPCLSVWGEACPGIAHQWAKKLGLVAMMSRLGSSLRRSHGYESGFDDGSRMRILLEFVVLYSSLYLAVTEQRHRS